MTSYCKGTTVDSPNDQRSYRGKHLRDFKYETTTKLTDRVEKHLDILYSKIKVIVFSACLTFRFLKLVLRITCNLFLQ